MQNYQSDTIEITEDFARLIGYYVADGSVIAGSQLVFSVCDADIILDLINIMTVAYPGVTYTELYREDGSSREIRFNVGKVWTQAFKDMCGENAHSKTVPDQILFGVKNLKIEFLKGYCLCDGCMKKGRYIEVATVSEELIDKLSLLLMTLNEIPFVTKKERVSPFSGELCEIYYLTITGLAENRLNLGFGCNAKFEVSKLNKNIVNNCETIQAVGIKESVSDLSEEIDVYDLSIENNENFLTAANIFVHNCRAGSQVPFSSINIGLPTSPDAALVCEAFLIQYDRGLGKGEQPIFPNIIFRVKAGVNRNPEDPYYYLFQLACRVAAKRMNPTFMNIDADFNKEYYDQGYVPATMGCRTYLMSNVNGEPGVEGRGNNAPTTINLPRIGIRAMLWMDEFKQAINTPVEKYDKVYMEHIVPYFLGLFDEKINKSRESLLHRYDVLKKLKVKDLPFVAGQGLMKGTEGLDPNDSIEPILKQGTWGIGFTGLAETLIALCGKHHGESELARDLGEKIIEHLRKRCDEFRDKDQLNWSCYATPAEGLSGKFVPVDRRIFGIIPGVTDKDYYTNSYHVPVNYSISIKDKLAIEAPYHKLCNGGHISYIEMDDYPQGSDIENIIRYAYENTNISYVGINFHIRYCKECGTYLHGENECPNCGSHDIQGVSRVTGYLSLDERFGPGKSAERLDRSNHNGDHTNNYHLDKEGED
jgi:anaerobic ribonucleoside-triphosphate reductase